MFCGREKLQSIHVQLLGSIESLVMMNLPFWIASDLVDETFTRPGKFDVVPSLR
jgi:hypothetical protein